METYREVATFSGCRGPTLRMAVMRARNHPSTGRGVSRVPFLHPGIICLITALSQLVASPTPLEAQVTLEERVSRTIGRAQNFLIASQVRDGSKEDGSWSRSSNRMALISHEVGVSSLAMLALLSSGLTAKDEPISRGLKYLRNVSLPTTQKTYQDSLMLMVFAAAKDGDRDRALMSKLVSRLESYQHKQGINLGGWDYGEQGGVDRSNSQFAVLGLREAAFAGIPVDHQVWERTKVYWEESQNPDGGWNYSNGIGGEPSRGSMSVAGVATMAILESFLRDSPDVQADGSPACCGDPKPNKSLERGVQWLGNNFSVMEHPNYAQNGYFLYYMYGMERAGRLSGRRYLGHHDWYREGADSLASSQIAGLGNWVGIDQFEQEKVVATSYALLFLSKGMCPVVINKLKYGVPDDPGNMAQIPWNRHSRDVRNLMDYITGLDGWPKLLSWQEVHISSALKRGGVQELLQAPILFFNGSEAPQFSPEEVNLLREYVSQGGFIFAESACRRKEFEQGMHDLVEQMFPDQTYRLRRLTADHPIYRSEFPLDADTVELWGVDVGCRTSIVYSPNDYACLWDKWMVAPPRNRNLQLAQRINKAMSVGTNVVAYVTGRNPPSKTERQDLAIAKKVQDTLERSQIQIAKIKHEGNWDVAPEAVSNLLAALNSVGGIETSTSKFNRSLTDGDLPNFPVIYMHGRNSFSLTKTEIERLREHLKRGGFLFADACCAAPLFDESFRKMIAEVDPEHPLQRIPADHDIFTDKVGHDLKVVRRRESSETIAGQPLQTRIVEGEPLLEGVEVDGQYRVIYSKYDLSCALQRQASLGCPGYLDEDAVKLAVNVVSYFLVK